MAFVEFPKSMYKGAKDASAKHFIVDDAEEEALARKDGYIPGSEFFSAEKPKSKGTK